MWIAPQVPPPVSRPASPAEEPTPVSGIEVVAAHGVPKVVATYPAAGAAAPPGALVLMVRFDHRMQPDSWDYGPAAGQPPCLQRPRLLKDGKTFVLMCSVGFNQHFNLTLNGARKGFVDLAGVAAPPYALGFTTGDSDPTPAVDDALKAAGLTDVDSPILDSKTPQAAP